MIMISTIALSDIVLEPCETLLSGRLLEPKGEIVVVDDGGAESDWPANAIPKRTPMPSCVAIERATQLTRALAGDQ